MDAGGTLTPSGDETKINIVPTSLTLTYRFDWLAERYGIPLAPYGRFAFERYNWWVTDGKGDWAKEGGTNGWSATGGLALLLDFIEPGAARTLDRETGVNHTYLFFDVTKSKVDDFGSKRAGTSRTRTCRSRSACCSFFERGCALPRAGPLPSQSLRCLSAGSSSRTRSRRSRLNGATHTPSPSGQRARTTPHGSTIIAFPKVWRFCE